MQRIAVRNENALQKIARSVSKTEYSGMVNRIIAARHTAAEEHLEAEPNGNIAPVAEVGAPHI